VYAIHYARQCFAVKQQPLRTHCNTMQHTDIRNTLQRTATHTFMEALFLSFFIVKQKPLRTHCNTLQHTDASQHTATLCNTHRHGGVVLVFLCSKAEAVHMRLQIPFRFASARLLSLVVVVVRFVWGGYD